MDLTDWKETLRVATKSRKKLFARVILQAIVSGMPVYSSECRIFLSENEKRRDLKKHCNIKLEKLRFDKFNGEIRKYSRFREGLKKTHKAGL